MSTDKSPRKNLYYTNDHEWIDFQGTVAYVGICLFKLTGFKQVQKVVFEKSSGFKRKGDLIATIKYKDYNIQVHMPVDGRVVQMNDIIQTENPGLLLEYPESSGWIALIVPTQPYERKNLWSQKQYQMNVKNNYPK